MQQKFKNLPELLPKIKEQKEDKTNAFHIIIDLKSYRKSVRGSNSTNDRVMCQSMHFVFRGIFLFFRIPTTLMPLEVDITDLYSNKIKISGEYRADSNSQHLYFGGVEFYNYEDSSKKVGFATCTVEVDFSKFEKGSAPGFSEYFKVIIKENARVSFKYIL